MHFIQNLRKPSAICAELAVLSVRRELRTNGLIFASRSLQKAAQHLHNGNGIHN